MLLEKMTYAIFDNVVLESNEVVICYFTCENDDYSGNDKYRLLIIRGV